MKWLSSLVGTLTAWFTPPLKQSLEDTSFEHLQHIEAEELATKFSLRDEGKRLGAGCVPPQDATQLSGPEASAINEVEKARRSYQAWAVRRLTTLDENIARYDLRHEINTALQADVVFNNKVANYLTTVDRDLNECNRSVGIANTELATFKKENQITREANYPTNTKKFLMYAVLVFLMVFEGAINGQIFKRGLEGGVIEGISYAFIFAFFNVITTYKLGSSGFRYIHHINFPKQIIGWIALLTAVLLSTSIGLMLGHFRMALNSQADQAFDIAWQGFITNPLSIGGMDSILLFGVTILFGIVAFFDGYNIDEKYPGFGPQQRKYEEALNDYNHQISDIHEEMSQIRTNAIEELEKTVVRSQAALANLSAEIINKRGAKERITSAMTTSQAAANAAVQIFRADNLLARNGAPFPPYFNTTPKLSEIEVPLFDTTNDLLVEKEMASLVERLISSAQDIRRRIETAFNEKYDQLIPINNHFNGN